MSLQKDVEILTPSTWEYDFLWNRVTEDVKRQINKDEPLIQYDWELYVKMERQGKCHVITKVEVSYASADQGTPQNARKP